ncbi:hypothetical protein TL16_g04308 [Triparma laevis f. inornata]|uniref:Uncharacterized protein n=1 Tax=Triparma laevis f. inornata TaxID=1714386 RepID=A0A9W7A529_9STRA|nr:hypothetical protein TL16_g04308 [Triparma laevis f. inornata]
MTPSTARAPSLNPSHCFTRSNPSSTVIGKALGYILPPAPAPFPVQEFELDAQYSGAVSCLDDKNTPPKFGFLTPSDQSSGFSRRVYFNHESFNVALEGGEGLSVGTMKKGQKFDFFIKKVSTKNGPKFNAYNITKLFEPTVVKSEPVDIKPNIIQLPSILPNPPPTPFELYCQSDKVTQSGKKLSQKSLREQYKDENVVSQYLKDKLALESKKKKEEFTTWCTEFSSNYHSLLSSPSQCLSIWNSIKNDNMIKPKKIKKEKVIELMEELILPVQPKTPIQMFAESRGESLREEMYEEVSEINEEEYDKRLRSEFNSEKNERMKLNIMEEYSVLRVKCDKDVKEIKKKKKRESKAHEKFEKLIEKAEEVDEGDEPNVGTVGVSTVNTSAVNTNNLNEYGIMKARSGDSIFSRVIKVRILEEWEGTDAKIINGMVKELKRVSVDWWSELEREEERREEEEVKKKKSRVGEKAESVFGKVDWAKRAEEMMKEKERKMEEEESESGESGEESGEEEESVDSKESGGEEDIFKTFEPKVKEEKVEKRKKRKAKVEESDSNDDDGDDKVEVVVQTPKKRKNIIVDSDED